MATVQAPEPAVGREPGAEAVARDRQAADGTILRKPSTHELD